jgi:membrane-bound metal-dependent hydrolase YbcI (DUF457 family)
VFGWRELPLHAVAIGALAGCWSHVVFDGMMHDDMAPFAPFSDANPLLHAVSVATLHRGCVVAGVVGIAILLARDAWRRRTR